jgi:negative modulator of initiation of replication
MKNIEIDEELYHFIASNTQFIGESASSILRRLLSLAQVANANVEKAENEPAVVVTKIPVFETSVAENEEASVQKETAISVDSSVHNKDINETVFNYINKEELAMQRGAVGRFLLILSALHRGHSALFSGITDISGRERLYFARSEEELTASGSSTNPRQIPDSPFWVITNSNTTRKKMMLTKVAIALGYSNEDAEKIRELL